MFFLLGIVFCISSGVNSDVQSYFKEVKLIPDIYDENAKIPEQKLSVSFGNNKVTFGEEYTPTYLKDPPIVDMNYDPNSYYTFMMFNPDSPSPKNPTFRHALMMLVTNIPGNDFSKGDIIVEYSNTAPMKNTGPNRYFLALYKQPGVINFSEAHVEPRERAYRLNWPLTNFLAKYHLTDLVAVHFQYSQWDEFASKMHAEFMSYKPKSKPT